MTQEKMKTKQDLIDEIRERLPYSRETITEVVQEFIEALRADLEQGNPVRIKEIGIFRTYVRKGGERRNPSNGKIYNVPDSFAPRLRFNVAIKRALNGTAADGYDDN